MKVFYTKNWFEIEKKLNRIGKTFYIDDPERIEVKINESKIEVELKDVLDFLSNLGYDFIGLGNKISDVKEIKSANEVSKLENVETLNSLIKKVKESKGSEECGAIGIFVGFVREISDGKKVLKLEYEKFDEIFYKKLEEIEKKLREYEGVVDVKIYHKSGVILPKEDIVYVVVMGKHRKDIWEPLRRSMEIIKRELPIWKKEVFVDGEVWVHDKNNEKKINPT